MSKEKIKISLCDLANDLNGYDNKSIPIGIGYIASYCKKFHGDSVDIKVHRSYTSFWNDVKDIPPDIAGFGSYDWNYNLTLAAIKKVKQLNPSCITVLGGANAEINLNDNKVFLERNKTVDFVVYGDVFYEIVTLGEPKQLFGQIDHRIEISAKCIRAREGLFDAS